MLKKLSAGEYSLKTVFWLFGVLGFIFFYIITNITHSGILRVICPHETLCSRNLVLYTLSNAPSLMLHGNSVLGYLSVHIFLGACFVMYMYAILKSLWKSSESYSGHKFWVYSAKFIIICLIFVSIKSLI